MRHGLIVRFIATSHLNGAGEVCRADLATVVEEEAQVDGHVKVDAKDVGLDGGAEADSGIQVNEPL